MSNENPPDFVEEFACSCGGRFKRTPSSDYTCTGCGEACSVTGRAVRDPEPVSLKELSRAFYDQPIDFKEAESRGWPGPYVEFTDADRQWWETLAELERKYFPELFTPTGDDERDNEGS